jgi:enamine deaminase RidA (YjgF/YER057c/UK114 family)
VLDHIAPPGVAPGNGYTHVVAGTGRLVAISGQIAIDNAGQLVGRDDAGAQARQVFENLGRCLTAAGATFDNVIKLTYFVTDVAWLPAIRRVRDTFVDTARPPASTAVQVIALVRPELLLEIEALAVIP